jgi:hypothetical protein
MKIQRFESPYASIKDVFRDNPAPGCAILHRTKHLYSRTRNGAWIGAGSESEVFELPLAVLNSPGGCIWLNPGRCATVVYRIGGEVFGVDMSNDPIRADGFGELGYVESGGRRDLIRRPNPLLPNLAKGYYRIEWFSDADLATFTKLETELP